MESENKFYRTLGITFSGAGNNINIGKNVIRVLGVPRYLTFRVNKSLTAFIIFACDSTDPLAYRVPENILNHQKMMRVYSKHFVRDVMSANQFAQDSTYTVYGKYYEKEKVVLFDLRAAFENRMSFDID